MLAGYKQEMKDMFENNAGLKRRFNFDDFGLLFEDLNEYEMQQVLTMKVKDEGLKFADIEDIPTISRFLWQRRRLPNFGYDTPSILLLP